MCNLFKCYYFYARMFKSAARNIYRSIHFILFYFTCVDGIIDRNGRDLAPIKTPVTGLEQINNICTAC